MRECMNKVLDLINAKTKCIWINTYEEKEVIQDLQQISLQLKQFHSIYSYSFATGIETVELKENSVQKKEAMNIDKMLKTIYNITNNIMPDEEEQEFLKEQGSIVFDNPNNIFVLKDFHLINDNPNVKRMFRDVVENKYKNHNNTIIVVSPFLSIPLEHEKLFSVVDYDTPNEEDISKLLNYALTASSTSLTEDEQRTIINSCKGLTFNEISHIMKLSIVKHKKIIAKEISDYKIDLVKKSNLLEYKVPNSSLEDIGGNKAFKSWINEVIMSVSTEAQEFGCEKIKGYLALGVPGSAKTIMAEALAASMNIPFLKLDMSKVLSSKVGSSEQNIAQAIRMIKSTAPCLLLIDEVEKTLSGMASSNQSDAGTMARVIGSILEFMSSDHEVFVVMTSNDASQLPPELTRAGRLDAIWFFDLPDTEERKEIFKIHYNKSITNIDDNIINYAANITNGYTGAEIKELVKSSIRKAFVRFTQNKTDKTITTDDIQKAFSEIIPISKSSKEKIFALQAYAKDRARHSNKMINQYGCDVSKNNEIVSILSIADLNRK